MTCSSICILSCLCLLVDEHDEKNKYEPEYENDWPDCWELGTFWCGQPCASAGFPWCSRPSRPLSAPGRCGSRSPGTQTWNALVNKRPDLFCWYMQKRRKINLLCCPSRTIMTAPAQLRPSPNSCSTVNSFSPTGETISVNFSSALIQNPIWKQFSEILWTFK